MHVIHNTIYKFYCLFSGNDE